jgi:hypothetical protein
VYVASLSEISIRSPGIKAVAPADWVHLEVLANLCGADNEQGPARDIGPTSAYRIGAVQVDEASARAVLSALKPLGIEAASAAAERHEAKHDGALAQWRLAVEPRKPRGSPVHMQDRRSLPAISNKKGEDFDI